MGFGVNPMNSTKKQKYMTLKNEPTRSVGSQYTTREEWRNSSRKNEEAEMTMKTRQLKTYGMQQKQF